MPHRHADSFVMVRGGGLLLENSNNSPMTVLFIETVDKQNDCTKLQDDEDQM